MHYQQSSLLRNVLDLEFRKYCAVIFSLELENAFHRDQTFYQGALRIIDLLIINYHDIYNYGVIREVYIFCIRIHVIDERTTLILSSDACQEMDVIQQQVAFAFFCAVGIAWTVCRVFLLLWKTTSGFRTYVWPHLTKRKTNLVAKYGSWAGTYIFISTRRRYGSGVALLARKSEQLVKKMPTRTEALREPCRLHRGGEAEIGRRWPAQNKTFPHKQQKKKLP